MPHYKIQKDSPPGFDKLINETDKASVLINRYGCEVIGYTVFDEENNVDLPLLWNNNNADPPSGGGWKNHATILFPIVGGLVNKQSTYGDHLITTKGNHGLARHSHFKLVGESTENKARLDYQLKANAETKGYYPFDFCLDIGYILQDNRLSIEMTITNNDTQDIPCSFGWHPGFNADLGLGGKKQDWQLLFKPGIYKHYLVNSDTQLTGEVVDEQYNGALAWDEKTLEGTILLEVAAHDNRTCTLYNPTLQRGVRVDFVDFPYFGLWSSQGQPFFCLEPWQGMDDHEKQEPFDKKVGLLTLAPGTNITKTASVAPLFGEE